MKVRVRLRLRLRVRLAAARLELCLQARPLPAGYLYTQPYRPTPNYRPTPHQAKTWDDVVEALTSNTPERTNEVCLLPPSAA